MDFWQLEGKSFLVFGVANRKSVAYHIGRQLVEVGSRPVYVVRSPPEAGIDGETAGRSRGSRLRRGIRRANRSSAALTRAAVGHQFEGLVHSIAFADYEGGVKPFHETSKTQFLRAMDISCYSLLPFATPVATC
jgi:enoyl-[acyl-carrier protein] reductase I